MNSDTQEIEIQLDGRYTNLVVPAGPAPEAAEAIAAKLRSEGYSATALDGVVTIGAPHNKAEFMRSFYRETLAAAQRRELGFSVSGFTLTPSESAEWFDRVHPPKPNRAQRRAMKRGKRS